MNESRGRYWDLEAGAWVESPSPATVPVQRPAEHADDGLDLAEVEQQYGVPI